MSIDRVASRPDGRTLAGRYAVLEPLEPARHGAALYAALHDGGDPALWTYLPYGPYPDAAAYATALPATVGDDLSAYVVLVDDRPLGIAAYLRSVPEHRSVEIGHIAFGAELQRTAAATEAILLLARHAFEDLGNRRLEWKCDARNDRSRAAAERFGFRYEGTFRQHMIVKGRNRDTAWFSILDGEWPGVRGEFERWLDPANFTEDGRQRTSLRMASR